MAEKKRITLSTELPGEGCDTRIWSVNCEHRDYKTGGEKYLCSTCGKIINLDHEIRHEIFPHIMGDTDNLY